MVCMDTSFLIALIRRDHKAEKKLEAYIAAEAILSTTPITACELFRGAYQSGRRERRKGQKFPCLSTNPRLLS